MAARLTHGATMVVWVEDTERSSMLITGCQSARARSPWKRFAVLAGLLGGSVTTAANAQEYPPLPGVPTITQPAQVQPAPADLPSVPADQTASDVRLQVYSVPSNLVGSIGAELQVVYHDDPQVRVTTDPKTGQLMVMAPDAVHRTIGSQLNAFMQRNQIPAGDRGMHVASSKQQVYQLRHLSWRELEDAIRRLVGPGLSVTTERNGELANLQMKNAAGMQDLVQVDRRLNQVTLLGNGPSVAGWNQVIYSLDQGQVDAQQATHVMPLSPAEPRGVKRAIRLVNATLQQSGPGDDTTEACVGVGDDEPTTAMGSIDSLGSESGLFGDVQIEFIEEIDLVIIRGSKRDVQRTLEVIEKIKEQAKETQPEVEVFPLEHANGEAVAELVTELYDNIYAPRQGSVSITALGQPNALLLIGRKEVVQSVKELVGKIDQPLDPQNQLKVIRLLYASSVDVEARIREFFVQNPPDSEPRVALGTRVKVLADYRTNSLIVQASPREMVEVEKLIDELDVEGTTAQNDVRVFRLKNTLADDLQAVIEEVITGQGAGGDTSLATPPSGRLSIIGRDGPVESGILAGVIVASDPSVNALVVRAPAQSMELIGQLINELDQLPSAEARIKVFEVQNGDAQSLAGLLQELFGLQVTAGQSSLFGLGNNNTAALTAGGEGSLVPLRISFDVRTNSVIVSGSESDLNVIEVLLLRLDEDGVETRRTEVVWLRNANAADVNTALNDFLSVQRQAVNQILFQGGFISTFEQVDREVFVVAEPTTNSLVVSATPRYFDTIMDVIERLDRRPPLVAIQVLIAEVQLDHSLELGAEWGIQDGLLFDRQSATGGTLQSPIFNLGTPLTGPSGGPGQTQNVAGQALSAFGLGRANSAGVGGLVLSASSEAVGVLIRALQEANRIQVLSRPQITTLDNREASTLVGQQVPRVQGVTNTQGVGQTINAVDVPVGLGIAVLPRVNQDGLIVMQVQIQNSSVGDPDSGIPVGFGPTGEAILSPIITSTEASTTISAYSGQTVVFAGLISKNRTSASRRIPILGSLPLVGPAFRFDTETEQRRELLVVLTPRIIQSDEDYETLKHVESSRMSWCLADVLNVHGDVGLSGGNGLWGPARSQMIYPDLQPSVIEQRSTPRSGAPFPGTGLIDGYPIGQDVESDPVEVDSNAQAASAGQQPVMKTVGFTRPLPSGTAGGAQSGPYK